MGTFDFSTLMQLNIEYGSKCLRTSMNGIKSQRSFGGVSDFLLRRTKFILLSARSDMKFRFIP